MPENIPAHVPDPLAPPMDPSTHNADIAAKQAAQDISGKSMAPVEAKGVSDSLDALLKVAEADAKKAPAADAPPVVDQTPAEKAAADKAALDASAEAAKTKAAADAVQARADAMFKDTPGLPPNASPKSAEAFSSVKRQAAQDIIARDEQITALKKQLADAAEKLKNPVPAEVEKELADHRAWRAKLDIDADPKFQSFDKTISESQEFIYAQLKKSPLIPDDVIAAIKKHGGPENVKMENIFKSINDPTIQRIVETKIAEIEQTKWSKEQAIKSAKENIAGYVEARQKEWQQAASSHQQATEQYWQQYSKGLTWLTPKELDPKLTPEEKKAVEEDNAFVTKVVQEIADAKNDDSPSMRAILLAGYAQLSHLQRTSAATEVKLKTAETNLAAANSLIERLKKAGASRLGGGAAPGGAPKVDPKPADQFTQRAGDALDKIAQQVTEENARVAASGGIR